MTSKTYRYGASKVIIKEDGAIDGLPVLAQVYNAQNALVYEFRTHTAGQQAADSAYRAAENRHYL